MRDLGRLLVVPSLMVVVVACGSATQPTATSIAVPTPTAAPSPMTIPSAAPTPTPTSATPTSEATPSSVSSPATVTIETGGGPCAMAELEGSVWVTNYYDATMVRIDGASNAIRQTVDLGTNPCGIAALDSKLWVAVLGDQSLIEYDPSTDTVAHTIDVGGQPWDVQAGFGSIWVPVRGANVVVRVDPAAGTVAASIPISGTVTGAAITATEVWVASQSGRIDRIDPDTNEVAGQIELDAPPYWFAVGSDSVIATESGNAQTVVLDATTGQVRSSAMTDPNPRDPGFVGGNFWVPSQSSGTLNIVSETGELLAQLPVPDARGPFVADEALGDGWILNYGGNTAVRLPTDFGLQ